MRRHSSDFLVTESNGKWYLRTTQGRVVRHVAVLFVGGVFMIGGGVWMDFLSTDDPLAWWRDSHVFTILGCLTAILLWWVGIWVWWIRHVPVSVDLETGAVHFGSKQICGPGSVESVSLSRDSNPDVYKRPTSLSLG